MSTTCLLLRNDSSSLALNDGLAISTSEVVVSIDDAESGFRETEKKLLKENPPNISSANLMRGIEKSSEIFYPK